MTKSIFVLLLSLCCMTSAVQAADSNAGIIGGSGGGSRGVGHRIPAIGAQVAGGAQQLSPPGALTTCTYFVDNSSTGCGGSGCLDSNNGTSLATAWLTLAKLGTQNLTAGQTACLVGQTTPNTTNGGIWREQYIVKGQGTGWGIGKQVTITSYDPSKPAIVTGASCYGAASGLCTGSTPVTWHQCTSNDALCHNSTDANITNVWEYTRPAVVYAGIYVDDPDVINGTTLWGDQTKFLLWASGLPGASSSRAQDHYQGDMTAGSFYDDGTRLYAWMADNSDPGTHVIEAATRKYYDGLVRNFSNTGQNKYVYFSYLKLIYLVDVGIWTSPQTSGNTIPTWYDHNQVGGFGAGPVANESGYYYSAAFQTYGTGPGSIPTATMTNTEVHITNNTVNWCGSHNCINTQGSIGPITITGNVVGASEHNGIDVKCSYNVDVENNYVHDMWAGTVIGSPDAPSFNQNAFYNSTEWNACVNGVITYQNNTGYNTNNGIECNANSTATSGTRTCREYNNTFVMTPTTRGNSCFFLLNQGDGETLTADVEDNLCYMPVNGIGFKQYLGAATVTEKYNLYYNTSGTNTNYYLGSLFTTLADWQASCGGGGACGTGDLWQVFPNLSDLMAGGG